MASNGAVIVVQVLAANTAAVEFIILDLLLSLKTNKDEDEDEDEDEDKDKDEFGIINGIKSFLKAS